MKTLLCNCNRTLPLNGQALAQTLNLPNAEVYTTLCRRDAPAFQRAATSGEELLVACTQEAPLFLQLNEQTQGAPSLQERPIRFVNIRELALWGAQGPQATPKVAALLAAAALPEPEPVATVGYRSQGRCLVIGEASAAQQAAQALGPGLSCTLLVQGGALEQQLLWPVHMASLQSLSGWLGAFKARWRGGNPIALDVCTRCNACIEACPEGAIDFSYQVNLSACRSHRDCVRVCEAAGAIDFSRAAEEHEAEFDIVLDLRRTPAFSQHALPQGYVHAPDEAAVWRALPRLREWVGEFDKPRFVQYRQNLCAHSRNEKVGCNACIEVCSASAIRSDASLKGKAGQAQRATAAQGGSAFAPARPVVGGSGGGVVVEPHLCVGCGACTTVCPSGALSYATPGPAEQGQRLRTLLGTYAKAGGREAVVLIHSQEAGRKLLHELGRAARVDPSGFKGLPARVLPLQAWHMASIGLEVWLSAVALGASQVWVLSTDDDAPQYREALREQMAVAQAILTGLGYAGEHLALIEARDARDLADLDARLQGKPAQGVVKPAAFALQADKRATLELALEHLLAQAPAAPQEAIALPPKASPLGGLQVDAQKCTLCLSCVGACPAGALGDNPEAPQLRFVEKNCVQCGLCVKTCPEQALSLQPRLWLADGAKARRQWQVIAQTQPYACIRCSKPFGTLKAVEGMLLKLAGHAMFQGRAAERLKMCADCRVIDIHTDPGETRITDL